MAGDFQIWFWRERISLNIFFFVNSIPFNPFNFSPFSYHGEGKEEGYPYPYGSDFEEYCEYLRNCLQR